ncbi:MAG TPA: proton-conducting transporter membrane subunit [Thermomicrobiales bacterium]|nr:proton-conducting transporter membrane subunit [Thermomicrobiales bacterium]
MNELGLPDTFALAPIAVMLLASALGPLFARPLARLARLLPSLLLMLAGSLGVFVAVDTLLTGRTLTFPGWAVTPYAAVSLRLDPLAAFFLLVISAPAVAVALYGIGYLDAAHDGHVPQPRTATDALLGAFLASMALVVLADSVLAFMLAWEAMSLVSFFLVIGDGRRADNRRAAYIYAVMTHIGAAFVLLAFLVLARNGGSLDFAALRAGADSLGRWERHGVTLLALIGFGSKMGLIPLHVWLPRAHPAAPSHVSALMSGVMVKMAVYGMARFVWEFVAPVPRWWGEALIVIGVISAVMGILYALMERDLKRVLAYSTVEHVGIIVIGLGVAAAATNRGHAEVAALALVATLAHTLNHSVFKGLLFLGAGAVQTGAGTRDLERLGGLVRRMPWTAGLFLVGSLAIVALPPLNGFVGEWLLFQSLLGLGSTAGTVTTATLVAAGAGALALTGALALACFVRAFGTGFLAQPRSEHARQAHEVAPTMLAGMALLAGATVVLGVAPLAIIRLLRSVTQDLTGAVAHPALGGSGVFDASQAASAYAPWLLIAGFVALGVLPWLIARLATGRGRERVSPTWVCGVRLEPRMQYSATGFAKPIRLIFQSLIRAHHSHALERQVVPPSGMTVRYVEGVHPIYERHLYQRSVTLLMAGSRYVRHLQSGSIRMYLAYLFVTLIVVLLVAR